MLGSKRLWLLELRFPVPNFWGVEGFVCEAVVFVVELAFDPFVPMIVMEGDRLRPMLGVECFDDADSEELRSRAWALLGLVAFASL